MEPQALVCSLGQGSHLFLTFYDAWHEQKGGSPNVIYDGPGFTF